MYLLACWQHRGNCSVQNSLADCHDDDSENIGVVLTQMKDSIPHSNKDID